MDCHLLALQYSRQISLFVTVEDIRHKAAFTINKICTYVRFATALNSFCEGHSERWQLKTTFMRWNWESPATKTVAAHAKRPPNERDQGQTEWWLDVSNEARTKLAFGITWNPLVWMAISPPNFSSVVITWIDCLSLPGQFIHRLHSRCGIIWEILVSYFGFSHTLPYKGCEEEDKGIEFQKIKINILRKN